MSNTPRDKVKLGNETTESHVDMVNRSPSIKNLESGWTPEYPLLEEIFSIEEVSTNAS